MENMGILKFALELKKLNPDTCLVYDTDSRPEIIYCNRDPRDLKYPTGYHYAARNRITNKHCSSSEPFECFVCYKDVSVAYQD